MSSPRVIAGSARGVRLKSYPGKSTRPITDRVKENLFNIIRDEIPNSRVLDLFGGIGSVGIEALSRGASFCQFIEKNPAVARIIQDNLEKTNLSKNANVKVADAFKFLLTDKPGAYDFIYVAPPQYFDLWEKTLLILDKNKLPLLKKSGCVIVQIDPVEEKDIFLENLQITDRRKYGNTVLLFFKTVISN